MPIGIHWLKFWGSTLDGRKKGEVYAPGSPERWDTIRHHDDPPPGLIVMVEVDKVLDDLDEVKHPDAPRTGLYRAFAVHRFAHRKPARKFPGGEKIERVLCKAVEGAPLDPKFLEEAMKEFRLENMRRRRESQAAWIRNSRRSQKAAPQNV